MKHSYSYVILRYVPDILSGERLNVGVVVYSAETRFLASATTSSFERLSRAFPNMQSDGLRVMVQVIDGEIAKLGSTLGSRPQLSSNESEIATLMASILPKDESSLQWSEPGFGVSNDLTATLNQLYERFVGRNEAHARMPSAAEKGVELTL